MQGETEHVPMGVLKVLLREHLKTPETISQFLHSNLLARLVGRAAQSRLGHWPARGQVLRAVALYMQEG
jgi:hypothetical protein